MTDFDFSSRFSADATRIEFPGDFGDAISRVHGKLDSNQDGFLSDGEITASKLRRFSGTDEKIVGLLLNSADRLSKLSTDRNWIGWSKGGVSPGDLKALQQLAANKELVRQGLLADLDFSFGDRDIHKPVATARFLEHDLDEIDTDRDGDIRRSELQAALNSKSTDTVAIACMLTEHFEEMTALGGNQNRITSGALNQFRYLLDPGAGLVSNYNSRRFSEKCGAAGFAGVAVAATGVAIGCALSGVGVGLAVIGGGIAVGAALGAVEVYSGGGYVLPPYEGKSGSSDGPLASRVAVPFSDSTDFGDTLAFGSRRNYRSDRSYGRSYGEPAAGSNQMLENHGAKSKPILEWSHFRTGK